MILTKKLGRIQEALDGGFGESQRLIAEIGASVVDMLIAKNIDYGSSAWKRPKLAPELDADTAIRVRMSDKIERLQNLLSPTQPGQQVSEESIEDTMRDLAGYIILWLARPDEKEGSSGLDR